MLMNSASGWRGGSSSVYFRVRQSTSLARFAPPHTKKFYDVTFGKRAAFPTELRQSIASHLDRDHRLIGKRRDQLDLLIGEQPSCPTHQQDYTNRYSLSEERDTEYRAIAGPSLEFRVSVFLIGKYIRYLDGFAFQ